MKIATVSRVILNHLKFLFLALPSWCVVGDDLGNSSSDQPSISLKSYQPRNAYPMQLKNKPDVSTKAAQLSLIDPTPPQEQPWHSCKLGNCNPVWILILRSNVHL